MIDCVDVVQSDVCVRERRETDIVDMVRVIEFVGTIIVDIIQSSNGASE